MNEAAEKVVALAAGRAVGARRLMSVLVDERTRLCVAGITGREGTFHTLNNRRYGTNVVGGVTPGKGGQDVEGIPVFDSWAAGRWRRSQPNTRRLDGTNDEQGRKLLREAALPNVYPAATMDEAAEKVVALASGRAVGAAA